MSAHWANTRTTGSSSCFRGLPLIARCPTGYAVVNNAVRNQSPQNQFAVGLADVAPGWIVGHGPDGRAHLPTGQLSRRRLLTSAFRCFRL